MPLSVGINHVTSSTADLDRLVTFYSQMFGARKVFESAKTDTHGRMAIVELGGTRYVKIVEDEAGTTASAPRTPSAHAVTERFGLAVDSYSALRDLRERMVRAGADADEIERLPAQWVLRFTDPDGTPLQVCAHAQPGDDAV
ncbi:VOC family protein [Pseudonocardia xinjiangensis]|uniref:VOC family protein n=1 Tax=Pseudonocardia xinjiangensis TaxID=75289 RepID=A0ABX1R970_9PSEU|nr:VOC family protein [Pseudonocardia xinjiangensis]NMH76419.1 VOC family protein [Pseudonocardia xinjiangensis]